MKNRLLRLRSKRNRSGRDRHSIRPFNAEFAFGAQSAVQTDLLDYAPGATATITANQFRVGETVAFQVLHVEPGADGRFGTADDLLGNNSGQGHLTWYVTDGGAGDLDGRANGKIVTQWYVNPDDSEGETFKLTAIGQQSGKLATTLFTDAFISSPLLLDTRSTTVGALADGTNLVFFSQFAGKPQGTGAINSFLQLSVPKSGIPGQQAGFNTQGIPRTALTGSLVQIGGQPYYEFRLDLNESTSNPKITLNTLQIYTSSQSTITSQTGLISQASKVLELQGATGVSGGIVRLDASLVGGGGGTGDLLFYIPQSAVLSTPNQPFVYLYAAMTGAEGGFEEFSYSSNPLGTTIPTVDLSVTKDDGKVTAIVGSNTTYTITVRNNGSTSPLTNLTLIDTLPGGLLNPIFTPSVGTYNPTTGLWSGLNLGSNQSITLSLTGTISPTATGTLTNTVTVTAPSGIIELNTANNTAVDQTTVLPPARLSVTTAFSETDLKKVLKSQVLNAVSGAPELQLIALPDQTVSFTIVVKNDGVTAAEHVTIFNDLTKFLPIGLKVLSIGSGGGIDLDTDSNAATGDGDRQTLEIKFDSIAPGTSRTITVNAKVTAEGPSLQSPGTPTNYITPIDFQGILGSTIPGTIILDQAIPEYHNVAIAGKFYLHSNLRKDANSSIVSFQNLNITLADPTILTQTPGTIIQIVQPGNVTKRLDIATTDLRGTLNNGKPLFIQAVENIFTNTNTPMVFDADLISRLRTYPTYNQSEFLPPTDIGESFLNLIWRKPDYASFESDYNTWINSIIGDGNLTNSSDEKAVIDYFVNNFINKGAGDSSLFESGTFNLTNLTTGQSATVTARAGQFTPTTPDYRIVVTNGSAQVIAPNQSGQTFPNLQTALDSLNFAQLTGVVVQVAGSGSVLTRLQTFSNSKLTNNWTVQEIQIASGVSTAIFKSENGAANIDFSSTSFVLGNPNTVIRIEGDNAGDILIGSQLNDMLVGNNGSDFMDGQAGDDVLMGGNGPDVFVLRRGDGTDTITDFETTSDRIGLAGGLTFNQLGFSGNTIWVNNNLGQPVEILATLTGVNTTTLTQSNFISV